MKKLLILSVISLVSILGLSSGSISAWHYNMSGSGSCQDDGSYKITWKVDNSSEPTKLEIKQSSNTEVVKSGDSVPARQTKSYEQVVDGSKAGSYKLELVADWKEDRKEVKRSAVVELKEACEQPETPEVPENPETPEVLPEVLPSTGAGNSAIVAFLGVSIVVTILHNLFSHPTRD